MPRLSRENAQTALVFGSVGENVYGTRKNEQRGFRTPDEAGRWNNLYTRRKSWPSKTGRWAILQKYAEKRALDRLSMCTGLIDSYAGKDVLDIACGGGHYGRVALEEGARWYGLDISIEMMRHARIHLDAYRARASLIAGDIQRLPFSSGSFDAIFCVGILSYFPNQALGPILLQLPDLLRSGGYLVLQTVRLDVLTWVRSRVPGWIPRPICLPGPLYPRTSNFLRRYFENTCMVQRKIIEVRKYLGILPFQTIYLFEKVGSPA